jgi:polyvinyl alcohol dehydrogenase (cytochrome)
MIWLKMRDARSIDQRACVALFLLTSACSTPAAQPAAPAAGGFAGTPTGAGPAAIGGSAATGMTTKPVAAAGTTGSMTQPVTMSAGGTAATLPSTAGTGPTTPIPGQAGTGVPSETGAAGSGTPPAAGGPSQWTMIAYDAAGTYNNTAETVLTKDNAGSLAVAWQADMGTNVYGAPLMVGDTVYASGGGTAVKAMKADTGDVIWTGAGLATTGSMAFDTGTLYLYTASGSIVAADAMTGKMKWSKAPKDNPGGDGSSSPVIAGNMLFIGGSNGGAEIIGGSFRGFMAALDKATGQGMWTSFTVPVGSAGASMWNSAAVDLAAGRVYVATGNNHGPPATDSSDAIIAMDIKTGDILWKNQRTMGDSWNGTAGTTDTAPPDADFGASPVLYETPVDGVMTKLVSAGQKIGAAHAVKAADGMLLWTRQLCTGHNNRDGSMGIFVNGAWSGKNMLYACNNAGASQLFGLNGATGEVAWMASLDGEVYGRISAANGVGFVGAGKNLVVFDTDTGKIIKMFPGKGGTVTGTVAIANGRVGFGEGMSWATAMSGRTLTMLKVMK